MKQSIINKEYDYPEISDKLIECLERDLGDTQYEHLEHCMCRLMMAYATQKSPDFNYIKYVPKGINRIQD